MANKSRASKNSGAMESKTANHRRATKKNEVKKQQQQRQATTKPRAATRIKQENDTKSGISSRTKTRNRVAEGGSSGINGEAGVILPTPKRQKLRPKSSSRVTPSPVQGPRTSSPWLAYDDLLQGDAPTEHVDWLHDAMFCARVIVGSENPREQSKLYDAMKNMAMYRDPLFARPFGVEVDDDDDDDVCWALDADRWKRYAATLYGYPKERLVAIQCEFLKDRKLHADILNGLTEEVRERRRGGKRFYLRALNCMFWDAFARYGIPRPPMPRWKLIVHPNITRKELYHMQLRAWDGFKSRAFAILAAVAEYPLEKNEKHDLPSITPLQHRGEMVPMCEHCMNEEGVIKYKYDWDREENLSEEDEKEEYDDWDRPCCSCVGCKTAFRIAKTVKLKWKHR
mmetsp:Transcript_7354/g.16000  ORF Transcript_7354/g.16000 Transcript_7354/m.16000 type:complete len:398 (+) Transcript_7354:167-1360(+)